MAYLVSIVKDYSNCCLVTNSKASTLRAIWAIILHFSWFCYAFIKTMLDFNNTLNKVKLVFILLLRWNKTSFSLERKLPLFVLYVSNSVADWQWSLKNVIISLTSATSFALYMHIHFFPKITEFMLFMYCAPYEVFFFVQPVTLAT